MSQEFTLEQRRARHGLDAVRQVQGTTKSADYKRMADGLAATIVNNGLGQACAMMLARGDGDDGTGQLYEDMGEWLSSKDYAAPYKGESSLIDAITQQDQSAYVRAQAEALAWLEWTKKFARAYLTEKGGSDE